MGYVILNSKLQDGAGAGVCRSRYFANKNKLYKFPNRKLRAYGGCLDSKRR